jgi:hypothetical protein
VPIEKLGRKEIRGFPDWVYERAVADEGTNPGRTANKAREYLRAVLSWAWEHELINSPPRFPKPREQRDVAGRHYLTKAEMNSLYFATHQMMRPRGWGCSVPIGRYWRSALVVFFNYGVDTGTIWKSAPLHEPMRATRRSSRDAMNLQLAEKKAETLALAIECDDLISCAGGRHGSTSEDCGDSERNPSHQGWSAFSGFPAR